MRGDFHPLFVEYFLWYFEQKALEFPAHKYWLKEVEMAEAELAKTAENRNEEFKAQFKTPKDILTINRPPKSVFIVGGNETAIELAQALSTFGSKVFLFVVIALPLVLGTV